MYDTYGYCPTIIIIFPVSYCTRVPGYRELMSSLPGYPGTRYPGTVHPMISAMVATIPGLEFAAPRHVVWYPVPGYTVLLLCAVHLALAYSLPLQRDHDTVRYVLTLYLIRTVYSIPCTVLYPV